MVGVGVHIYQRLSRSPTLPTVSPLILNASIHHLRPLMWLYLTIYLSDLIKEWYEW